MHPIVAEDLERICGAPLDWSALEGATVLITGAGGFLGSLITESLLFQNTRRTGAKTQVIGLARDRVRAEARFAAYASRDDLELVFQDVCAPLNLSRRVDCIIHAASQASPKYYGTDPLGTLAPNVLGTHQLLALAAKDGASSFLYVSSSEVYGHLDDACVPTPEHTFGSLDPMDPRSCYAESKRMGENLCVSWWRQHGVPVRVVRPFHTYGPGMRLDDGRVFADFVSDIVHNRDIVMRSDGLASRAFCYAADAVEGFFTVLFRGDCGQAYNVGNDGAEVTVLGLAEMLTGLFPEKRLSVVRLPHETPPGYIRSTVLRNCPDTAKVRALGWSPKTGLREGFRRTVQSFENAAG